MHVYAIESPQGLVKIGRSGNPDQRIGALSSAGGFEPVSVWYSFPLPDAAFVEKAAHKALAGARQVGEWFQVAFDDAVRVVQASIITPPAEPQFSHFLREAITAKGVTQIELCREVCATQTQLSRWISGKFEPSFEYLRRLSVALGTTPNDLLGFNDAVAPATFSARLKIARKKAGLTQLQLATIGEVTESAIRQWERGTIQKQDAAALLKIARALNVSPYWLMFGDQA